MGYHVVQRFQKEKFEANTIKPSKNQKDAVNEMTLLKNKISQLEISLELAERTVPRKFPNIKFLNYRDRKRILVNIKQVVQSNCTHFSYIKLGNWRGWICWIISS